MSLEARNLSLKSWLDKVDARQIVLPRFQRYEAWSNREIADLLLTVLQGLPAGSLLTQQVAGEPLFKWRSLHGAPESGEHITALLLDGQQRLTALWRSLNDNYDQAPAGRTFMIKLADDVLNPTPVEIRAQSTVVKNGQRFPQWLDSPMECWQRRLVPLSLLRPGRDNNQLMQWAQAAVGPEAIVQAMPLLSALNTMSGLFSNYNLPFLELPAATPREVVLDVFVKLNTRSVRLSAFDIIVAEVETLNESLHTLVESIKHRVPNLLHYDSTPEDLMLSTACLLQDRVPNQSGYFGLDLEKMVQDWDIIERGVAAGVQFLDDERVFDDARLPTEGPLAPLFALWAKAPTQPDQLGQFRHLMRRYLWRSFFSDRYERAAATAAFQDYRALRDVVQNAGDEAAIPIFDETSHLLPSAEALTTAAWPRSRQRLARAVLLLSLRGSALDVADAAPLNHTNLNRREYHHLYPVDYLKQNGKSEAEAMRALNCALISWRTNRTISNKAPQQYLEERIKAAPGDSAPAGDAVRHRLATHGISLQSLSANDYEAFLQDRAVWAEAAIRALSAGQEWTP